MKRNWNWRWLGRAFLCMLLICALLTTVAVGEDGNVIRLDDGTMAEPEGGQMPLDLSSLLTDLEPGISGASDSAAEGQAVESEVISNEHTASNDEIKFPAGYYKIVAANGRGKGDELYFDRNASWKDLKWREERTIWYMMTYYPIMLADDTNYILGLLNCEGGAPVKCSPNLDSRKTMVFRSKALCVHKKRRAFALGYNVSTRQWSHPMLWLHLRIRTAAKYLFASFLP